MTRTPKGWTALAATLGLFSVAAGAFGAHGVADAKAAEWLRTSGEYGLLHALAVLACAALSERLEPLRARLAAGLFLAGGLIFSGTLVLLALGAPRILGAVTPIGGLMLMAGWMTLGLAAITRRKAS